MVTLDRVTIEHQCRTPGRSGTTRAGLDTYVRIGRRRDSLRSSSSSRLFPQDAYATGEGLSFLHPQARRCLLMSSEPWCKTQELQATALGYRRVSRPRRFPWSGEVYPIAASPYSFTSPRWSLLFSCARASLIQEKAVGRCPLPPPFLSLPLIGSRWRNVTPVALR